MVDKRIANALKKCLFVKKNDKVLIVTDTNKIMLARKFEKAAKSLSNHVSLISMKPTGQHGIEPPKRIGKEMLKNDVVVEVTRWSMTHTYASTNADKRGIRIASLPNFTENMIPALDINYKRLEIISKKISDILRKGKNIHVTTPYGTDLRFRIGKFVFSETPKDGFFNMPLGEVGAAPSRMNGVLVFNTYQDMIKKPTRMVIKNNRIVDFEKSKNGNIIKKILSVDKNSRRAAEFAIGTNEKAKLVYNILEDEKILGTCHIAFGTNISFRGRFKSKVHIDLMIFKPTIKVNGKAIMKDGKPKW